MFCKYHNHRRSKRGAPEGPGPPNNFCGGAQVSHSPPNNFGRNYNISKVLLLVLKVLFILHIFIFLSPESILISFIIFPKIFQHRRGPPPPDLPQLNEGTRFAFVLHYRASTWHLPQIIFQMTCSGPPPIKNNLLRLCTEAR